MTTFTPTQRRPDAPFIIADYGKLFGSLHQKLNKAGSFHGAARLEAPDPDSDATLVIVEKLSDGGEKVVCKHTIRGLDAEGVAYFVLDGKAMPSPDYAVELARRAGMSDDEIAKL